MSSTTEFLRRLFPAQKELIKIFSGCNPEPPNSIATIHVFDPKEVMTDSLRASIPEIAGFYTALIPAHLGSFQFNWEYKPSPPGASEINALGRMDFPVYLFHHKGSYESSVSSLHDLMQNHRISATPEIWSIEELSDNSTRAELKEVDDVYTEIEGSWADDTTLGYGFPGDYYSDDSANCHKLIIIKLDAMVEQSRTGDEVDRFKWCLIHELGHTLSLGHTAKTRMHLEYEIGFQNFIETQVSKIALTLTKLSQT